MPQEMKQVNGRWVVTGNQQSSDLVPFVRPGSNSGGPRPIGARATLRNKPVQWAGDGYGWQSPASFRKLQASGKLNPPARQPQRSWWDKLRNDALYEVKQLQSGNVGRAIQNVYGSVLAIPRDAALAVIGSNDSGNRMAYSLYQRHVERKPTANPSAGRAGEVLDSQVDAAYRLLGATPPSQMTPAQRELDTISRSLALNVQLAAIPGAGLGAAGATTALGTAVRGGAAWALNEVLSNYLDDNTGGNIVNLVNQLTGAKLPGAVEVGKADMVDAANQSLVPNAAFGLGLGAASGAVLSNVLRRTRAGREIEVVQRARAAQENAGLIEKAEDGGYRFTEQAQQPAIAPVKVEDVTPAQAAPAASPMDDFKAANAAMEEQLGMQPPAAAAPDQAAVPSIEDATTENFGKAQAGDLPEGDLEVNPWDIEYDPALPESDALGRVVDELDDEELMVVAQGQGPVVEQVNQLVETRPPLEVNPSARLDMTAAPSANLAQPVVPFSDQWQALPTDQLKSLASPNNSPDLFQRIQGMTGKEWEELSKTDILDGLASFEADGITVLPNRLAPGQRVMRTADIFTDPINLQYKDNVDAGGVQRQGSLEGLENWSTDAEGVIQVWTNPMDGKTYVVNGHNRLAAAKRLGIPSLRVEELLASTAEQARAQGAIANIASGGGTVFDAAKFLRDSGVTDPAQLKQMGIPLDSGLGAQGLALSRLPGNLFQDAVDGRLSLGKAVALGGSGLDETQMQAAVRAMGGTDITDAAFNEVLQQARNAPVMQGEQVDLFGNTESMSLMRQKGELAAKIRADLIGDKNLFGRVGRNANRLQEAGNRISVQGSTQVAMDAQQVLANFDATKYAEGTPISQLLNEGAMEIARGAKPAAIARRIKAQLVKAAEATPPIEIQSDLLNAAAKAEEAPIPAEPAALPAAERQALRAQVIQKAIANGEVRPPSTPIPELPDAPRVRADEAQAEIAAQAMPVAEIPAEAGRKLNPVKERSAAESLMNWVNGGLPPERHSIRTIDQAIELVRAKNQVLDPDRIPGLDVDTARNDRAMGRSTPNTEAVAAAYRQFYGLPEPVPVIRPGGKAAQAVADELRLAVEHGKSDAALRWDQEEALRDAFDYEARSFDEKKDLGAIEGWDDVMPAEVMPTEKLPSIADTLGKTLRAMAESDARLFRTIGEMQQVTRKAINELSGGEPAAKVRLTPLQRAEIENFNGTLIEEMGIDLGGPMTREQLEALEKSIRSDFAPPELGGIDETPGASRRSMIGVADRMRQAIDKMSGAPSLAPAPVRPEPLRLAQAASQPELQLPLSLRKSSPRYGRATIVFESDLDRAAYTLANDAVRPSKAADKFRIVVKEAGLDLNEVIAHGKRVKAAIKQAAGGGAAPQSAMELNIPAQPFGEVVKPPAKAGDIAVRQQIEANNQTMDQIRRKAQQEGC